MGLPCFAQSVGIINYVFVLFCNVQPADYHSHTEIVLSCLFVFGRVILSDLRQMPPLEVFHDLDKAGQAQLLVNAVHAHQFFCKAT